MNYVSENKYLGALIKRRGKLYESLRKRYPVIIEHIERSIDNKTCPFCGKRFKYSYVVIRHLKHDRYCSSILVSLVNLMMERAKQDELLDELSRYTGNDNVITITYRNH